MSGLRRSEACTVSQLISPFALRSSTCPSLRHMQLNDSRSLTGNGSDDIICTAQISVQSHALERECPAPCIQPANRKWLITVKKDFSVQ